MLPRIFLFAAVVYTLFCVGLYFPGCQYSPAPDEILRKNEMFMSHMLADYSFSNYGVGKIGRPTWPPKGILNILSTGTDCMQKTEMHNVTWRYLGCVFTYEHENAEVTGTTVDNILSAGNAALLVRPSGDGKNVHVFYFVKKAPGVNSWDIEAWACEFICK